jgi:hypothetical protein
MTSHTYLQVTIILQLMTIRITLALKSVLRLTLITRSPISKIAHRNCLREGIFSYQTRSLIQPKRGKCLYSKLQEFRSQSTLQASNPHQFKKVQACTTRLRGATQLPIPKYQMLVGAGMPALPASAK